MIYHSPRISSVFLYFLTQFIREEEYGPYKHLGLLSSLPDDWETLMVSLSNSAPNGKLTMSMVKDVLFNEEARRKEMGTTIHNGTQALVGKGRGRSQGKAGGSSNQKEICIQGSHV